MANLLIVVALAGAGAYLVRRVLRSFPAARGIDVGAVSNTWIAEHHREEPR
jgi:flagellar biogenesis protein FliO